MLAPFLVGLIGCQPAVPEGRFGCTTAADCPEGWHCRPDRTCWSSPGRIDAGTRDAGSTDAGPLDAGPRDAGPGDAGGRDAGPTDAGPECTRPEDCDDGIFCNGIEACVESECVSGAAITCEGDLVCDEARGRCDCASGVRCGASCRPACCPGSTSGSCGRCGTTTCNSEGTGTTCEGQHGNCDPGYSCIADACADPCPTGTRRECGSGCVLSGCF